MWNYYGNTTVGLPSKRKRKGRGKEENRKEVEEKRKRIVEIYNLYCTKLSQVQRVTDKREKAIDNFLKEFSVEQFEVICKKANNTAFLVGQNNRKWKADFDFLMRVDKATSILEDKYSQNVETETSGNIFADIGREEGVFE